MKPKKDTQQGAARELGGEPEYQKLVEIRGPTGGTKELTSGLERSTYKTSEKVATGLCNKEVTGKALRNQYWWSGGDKR